MSRKHPNAEELRVRKENTRKELEKRSKPIFIGRDKEKVKIEWTSLTAIHSNTVMQKRKPCPCKYDYCTVKNG